MENYFSIFLLQLILFTSLSAAENNKAVKSELLRAIHFNNAKEIHAIAKTQKDVISADPVLQRMVDAYFAEEDLAINELKEQVILQHKREQKELAEAILAKKAEEERLALLAEKTSTVNEESSLKEESVAIATEQAKPPRAKPNVAKEKKKVLKPLPAPTYAPKIVKKRTKTEKNKLSKINIAGKWRADKNKKDVTFNVFSDNRFVLIESNGSGLLRLDGVYEQVDDQLKLDIQKITYNVRSRIAAVQRIYELKAASSKELVLVDEKGEIAYSFVR